jgi:hypothetical protein
MPDLHIGRSPKREKGLNTRTCLAAINERGYFENHDALP